MPDQPHKTAEGLPDRETAVGLLRQMIAIRRFEERVVQIYPTDVMVTPVHLHTGQEAVPVGVCSQLTAADTIFFSHRTHGPALAKGMPMKLLMAELYGRTTGCSRGYGGSMHVIDPPHGMLGSSSIVGGSIALGVGSALASRLQGAEWIAVSYFGDGATDAGIFWESLNIAALKKAPVLFVCEDNALSNVMSKSDHLFVDPSDIAEHFMPVWRADGTDCLSVYWSAQEAVATVRSRRLPAFLHCRTKRWMKHQGVEWDDLEFNPVDVKTDCPICKLQDRLLAGGLIRPDEIDAIVADVDREIDEAVAFAKAGPLPQPGDLVREV